MKCPICHESGHRAEDCHQAPAGIRKREFSAEERRAKEREIQQVEKGFFEKLRSVLGKVPFVLDAVAMYYAMVDPKTPFWVKASVAGALAYFISPVDVIPDFVPVVGYADDAAVIYMTFAVVHHHITETHIADAKRYLGRT